MEILRATDSDSAKLKSFFEQVFLPGAVDFAIERSGNFFDQYRLFSDDYETMMMIDDGGEIAGMASVLFREGMIRGDKQVWGYATDLRIKPTRKAISQWAQKFLPELERACEERRCKYVFSAVQTSDNKAYNALIRPASHTRRRLPRYHLVNKFRIVGLHGRVPFSEKPLMSIKLAELKHGDLEPLCTYLQERSMRRPLGKIHTPQNFIEEMSRWPGLGLNNFRIARDSRGKILGCAALWDARVVQSFIPQAYNGFAQTLSQTLWIASLAKLVRPLAEIGEPMRMQYLTHLCCETPEAFHRLADDAFSRLPKSDFLAYLHFRGNWRTLPPPSFISTTTPYGFYLVLPPNMEAPDLISRKALTETLMGEAGSPLDLLPPEFEIAWL